MSYTIALDYPNLPVGGTLIIDGLGEFENGQSYDISDEDAAQYQARKAVISSDYDEKGQLHTTVAVGPTLAEVFEGHPNITVTITPPVVVPPKVAVVPPVTQVSTSPVVNVNTGKE